MDGGSRALTASEARAFYDRFGKKQDTQGFYEGPALEDLIRHAAFPEARRVFEFGCGTGKFAARLIEEHLPGSATYLGCDVSPVMVGLAAQRLEAYSERAMAIQSDGAVRFPLCDHAVDRVISTYVLDLLSEADTRAAFAEAHRVLIPGGRLCLAGLTRGTSLPSRVVSSLWAAVFRVRPSLVGGCRPVVLDAYAERALWQQTHRAVVTPFGVPSEVLVLAAKRGPGG